MTRTARLLLLTAVALLPFACAEHVHHQKVLREFPVLTPVVYPHRLNQSLCGWEYINRGCMTIT